MKSKNQRSGTGGERKLKDFPSIPDTPPPEPKKDKEVIQLEKELYREKIYLSILQKENTEIEKILLDLGRELNYVKNNFPHNLDGDGKIHADNDYWFKYEAQMEVNRKLERERRHLESEIKQMEEQGMINLDSLTQSELILYVKQLERTKTDLLSDLRAKEWSLDKQAKDYHHLNETKRALEAEIKHYDGEHALFHHYKRISCPSASRHSSARRIGRAAGGLHRKIGSVSHENLSTSSVPGDMFRSLDESKLKMQQSHENRTEVSMDGRKKSVMTKGKGNASVGSLPELSEKRSKTPPSTKTVRKKSEQHAVVRSRSSPCTKRPSSAIRIVVTDESENVDEWRSSGGSETPVTARTESWNESGIGSPSDYYEDDFEESDGEAGKETGNVTEQFRGRKRNRGFSSEGTFPASRRETKRR